MSCSDFAIATGDQLMEKRRVRRLRSPGASPSFSTAKKFEPCLLEPNVFISEGGGASPYLCSNPKARVKPDSRALNPCLRALYSSWLASFKNSCAKTAQRRANSFAVSIRHGSSDVCAKTIVANESQVPSKLLRLFHSDPSPRCNFMTTSRSALVLHSIAQA